MKYVPENAYGDVRGQRVMTHGVELGVTRASSRDLEAATATLVNAFVRGNPGMRAQGAQRRVRMAGRPALGTTLVGRSAVGGSERVGLFTALLANGDLFYYATVVPDGEAERYGGTFERVGQSIRLNDR